MMTRDHFITLFSLFRPS